MHQKLGRNDPCPCGSGKKYKFCHGQPGHVTPLETTPSAGWQVGDVVDLDDDDFEDDDDWPDVALPYVDDLLLGLGAPFLSDRQTPLDKALLKVDEAYAASGNKRRRLLHEALQIYPDCADAYIALAEEPRTKDAEAIAYYEQALAADARVRAEAAQSAVFADHFIANDWTNFTDAITGKALLIWKSGRRDEAIAQLEAALSANPQLDGVRMTLMNWYFLTDQAQPGRALELLRAFDRAPTFPWSWALALAHFAEQGDALASRWWLTQCRFQNTHVPALLTGRRRLPKRLPNPEHSQPGDRAEAEFYALTFMDVWKAIPGALEWLKQFPDNEPIEVLGPGSRVDGWRLFLNSYENSGYVKCPECGIPTAKRKFSIAALVEPNFVPVARLEARACDACNLLIVKAAELTDAINVVIEPQASVKMQPFMPLGTVDHAVARQLPDALLPLDAAREHVRLFQEPVSYPPSNYEYQPLFGSEFARALFGDEFADDAFPDIADEDPNVIDIG